MTNTERTIASAVLFHLATANADACHFSDLMLAALRVDLDDVGRDELEDMLCDVLGVLREVDQIERVDMGDFPAVYRRLS